MVHNLNPFYKIVASTQMSTSNNNELGIDDLGIIMNFDILFGVETMGSINSTSPIIVKIVGVVNFGDLVDGTLPSKNLHVQPYYSIMQFAQEMP